MHKTYSRKYTILSVWKAGRGLAKFEAVVLEELNSGALERMAGQIVNCLQRGWQEKGLINVAEERQRSNPPVELSVIGSFRCDFFLDAPLPIFVRDYINFWLGLGKYYFVYN